MKSGALIFIALLGWLCGTSFDTTDAPPKTLTLHDLVNRPDRWPATVTLKHDYRFTSCAVATPVV